MNDATHTCQEIAATDGAGPAAQEQRAGALLTLIKGLCCLHCLICLLP